VCTEEFHYPLHVGQLLSRGKGKVKVKVIRPIPDLGGQPAGDDYKAGGRLPLV